MLIVITGNKGSGKSTLLTRRLYYDYCRGRTIYANYGVRFPHHDIKLDDMMIHNLDLKDADIAIDEAQIFLDCRTSATKRNRLFSYIMLQSRKRHTDIYVTAQYLSHLDIRIRTAMDLWCQCVAYVKKKKNGNTILVPATAEDADNHKIDAIVVTEYNMGNEQIKKVIFSPIPWFKMFDTDYFQQITNDED